MKRPILACVLTTGLALALVPVLVPLLPSAARAHSPEAVPKDAALLENYKAGLAAYMKRDYGTALQRWQPLAEQGFSAAQLFVGFMYQNGLGLPKNQAAAVSWFRRAAERNDVLAQLRLALMYRHGQGVSQDDAQAYVWAGLAGREHGHTQKQAKALQQKLEARMTPAQIAEAQRLIDEWRAQ